MTDAQLFSSCIIRWPPLTIPRFYPFPRPNEVLAASTRTALTIRAQSLLFKTPWNT